MFPQPPFQHQPQQQQYRRYSSLPVLGPPPPGIRQTTASVHPYYGPPNPNNPLFHNHPLFPPPLPQRSPVGFVPNPPFLPHPPSFRSFSNPQRRPINDPQMNSFSHFRPPPNQYDPRYLPAPLPPPPAYLSNMENMHRQHQQRLHESNFRNHSLPSRPLMSPSPNIRPSLPKAFFPRDYGKYVKQQQSGPQKIQEIESPKTSFSDAVIESLEIIKRNQDKESVKSEALDKQSGKKENKLVLERVLEVEIDSEMDDSVIDDELIIIVDNLSETSIEDDNDDKTICYWSCCKCKIKVKEPDAIYFFAAKPYGVIKFCDNCKHYICPWCMHPSDLSVMTAMRNKGLQRVNHSKSY